MILIQYEGKMCDTNNSYRKIDCIILPYSASAIYNNLIIKNKHKKPEVIVIHHDIVCSVSTKTSVQNKTKFIRCFKHANEKSITITQVAWCNLGYENMLIVTSTAGVQIFNEPEECLFSHPCSDVESNLSFARGIAVFNSFYFCIGNNAGCIRVFSPPDLEDEINFVDRKHNHNYAISDLSAYKDFLASVDEGGIVILWQLEGEELIHKITVSSLSNCTGIRLKRDWFITVYASGSIRLYNINKDSSIVTFLTLEITAHARAITAFDISDNNEYLLTVSEDSFAKIWQFYKDGNLQKIKHFCNILIKDNMLIGGKFLTSNGNKFCTTSYDSNIINCFSL